MKRWIVPFVIACLFPTTALAKPDADVSAKAPTFGVGARVGGYGFRDPSGDELTWEICRMNGTGVFGTVDFARYFFGEVSMDLYHTLAKSETNRVSFLPAIAVGARMLPDWWISPYVQVGAGPEFTRLELGGLRQRKVLPFAFMGIGGELNIKQLHFGSNVRVHTMGLPDSEGAYDAGYYDVESELPETIATRQEVAAQVQFTVRYTF